MAERDYAGIARQYARAVLTDRIPACRWVKLACQRQIDDLARFKGKGSPYRFNPVLTDAAGLRYRPADRVCAFVEALRHVKGPLAGERIRLEPWQVFILTTVFGWVKPNGRRRFRRSYVEVPRGNAKSTTSSAVGLYMLAADGEGGGEIYSLATTRDQARIVFGDAQAMARNDHSFREAFGIEVNAHNINIVRTGSKFEALSAEGSTLDGLNIHFGCVDELHAHKTRMVYDVVETGTGKRDNSLLWVITTAGSNRAGICYEVRTFVTKLLEGLFEDDSQFGIIYGLDSEPYVQPLEPMPALAELERSCDCGRVHSTQIEKLWVEVCAKHATTTGIGTRGRNAAKNILTGQSEPEECVAVATNSGCSTAILNPKRERYKNRPSGQREIRTKSEPHTGVGLPSPGSPGRCSTANDMSNTASLATSTTNDSPSKAENVRSAAKNESICAWITATAQELFVDSCAPNAIRHLVFSEILNLVYDAHLPTCKARASDIEYGRLLVKRPPDDWASEEALIKANPNWGISVRPEVLLPLQAKAMQMPSAINNFKTKHLNEWVNADTSWMDMRAWEACADPTLLEEDFAGEECFVALDLASKVDIAAKAKLFLREGRYYAFLTYYLPEAAAEDGRNSQYSGWSRRGLLTLTPGNVTDFDQIEAELLSDAGKYNVVEVPFDPFQATQLSSHMLAEGLPMVEMRPTVLNFSEPMKQLEALVLSKRLVHNGDPILAWMVSNVVCHRDAKDNIYPRKEREENKIDGVVALIMALGRMMTRTDAPPVIDSDYEMMVI